MVVLSDTNHVLQRYGMYIGGLGNTSSHGFFYHEGSFTYMHYDSTPGLVKIVNEILDNAIDEGIRTQFKHSNNINVYIRNNKVTIEDNGRGIPVEKIYYDEKDESIWEWSPVLAFCHKQSGTNFDDDDETEDDRVGIGMNGVGSFAANCFSKKFVAETRDGKKRCTITCKNNLSEQDVEIKSDRSATGTTVSFVPDYKRFGVEGFDALHTSLIEQRLVHLAVSYPKIRFKFNGRVVKIRSTRDYLRAFNDEFEFIESDNYIIAVMPNPSDDFRHSSYVNGIHTKKGGNHVDYIVGEVTYGLRKRIAKKYKSIKPGDIKNKIQVVTVFRNFKNPASDSQTKETLSNDPSEIKAFLGDVDWDKLVYKLWKNEAVLDPIIESYKIKEELKARAEVKAKLKKINKKPKVEKFLPPTKNWTHLLLCEGDSAKGGLMPALGREDIGYFPMCGVPLNAFEVTINKLTSNKEFQSIIGILKLELDAETELTFENIIIAADADADGAHIQGLIIGFFAKYAPYLLKQGRIKCLRTPIVVLKQKDKIKHFFMDMESYNKFAKKKNTSRFEMHYYKGYGSWDPEELEELFSEHGGIDEFLETMVVDNMADEVMYSWLSGNCSDRRKVFIQSKPFDIFDI